MPPLPRMDTPPTDWMPYQNRQIDMLLDLWAVTLIKHNDAPPFANHKDMYAAIDVTLLGDVPWKSFMMCYNGIKPQDNIPLWMTTKYDVWCRDPLELVGNMLTNSNFDGEIKFLPYHDYTTDNKWYWKNLMSGDWAWKQADLIAQNLKTHGSTFVPLIIGSNKTIVSVATGHMEYHLLYLSIGNIFNICNIGPYIADYPEQVMLSGVMQCLADPKDLDGGQPCLHQHEEHTELLVDQLTYTYKQLWFEYGIIGNLIPFTNYFIHADIHELLSSDLLHQIIKGTFKDHLVDWVEEYLTITHSAHHAAEIMDDIDRRYVNY
ncbi:hypothetical protein BDR07DRAFT_1448544 [Suillus spraguei]|nr:hypothetical protein BDR07DRAFT_1448544 [Suillus spraguei]